MTIRPHTFRNLIIAILLVAVGATGGYRYAQTGTLLGMSRPDWLPVPKSTVTNTATPTNRVGQVDFSTFWEVWNLLEANYLEPDKVQAAAMVDGAIGGMTSAIGDPYTMYLPPEDNQRRAEDLAGAFYGVGIELGYVDQVLAVVTPLNGSPADKAGVKAGDLILHVKDESKKLDSDTTGWSLDEAVNHIRGAKGTKVTLTLFRKDNGQQPFEVSIERGEIVVPSVELEFVEHQGKRVAHLRLSQFGERTNAEWDKAVTEIANQRTSIAGVVLDLRNNPGGFFDGAIYTASEFISSGTIVSQKGKASSQDFPAKGKGRLTDIPVEVLVNKGSASSSEILAGALKDRKGAKLIGEKTFGKGTVQDRLELSNGGGLHVTIARFLLPKGEWIHDTGIPVDIEVQDNADTPEDEVLNKAIETL